MNKSMTYYPSPVINTLTINSEKALILSLKIYDMSGKLIISVNNINKLITDIDLSTQTTGLYNILINTEKGQSCNKIVKQ
ncbi:MAG: T9SS type A sorting domain-containing protein [Bacteroidetes bacterium]|jgi:hypothetical protein|nr:T9SS type A sorting domain-containing protein [Bacteroidota bacterium]